jgi:hypothetical protein
VAGDALRGFEGAVIFLTHFKVAMFVEDSLHGGYRSALHNGRNNEAAMRLEFAFCLPPPSVSIAGDLQQLIYVIRGISHTLAMR